MNSNQFLEKYQNLNAAQKSAVDAIEGAVMVIAGPGTGKTQILTLRIANILLKTQINPENVLALTFTESGVSEMRKRLVSIIGTLGYRVNIHTFHGFCNDVIKSHSEYFHQFISSDSASAVDQIAIMEQVIESAELKLLRPIGDVTYYVRPALHSISELKKEGVTPDQFEEALSLQIAEFAVIPDLYHEKGQYKGKMKGIYQKQQDAIEKNKELLMLYRGYQAELQNRKLYDFDDMLIEVIRVLEQNESLLLQLQEQFQYILVDEHQDTNTAQNRIVELLCNFYENPNLFVVGDEKQAIYRFQGASLENFLYFKKLYPEAILINLEENYRSTQSILDAAGSLIKHNESSNVLPLPIDLKSNSKHPNQHIKIVEFSDFYSEYAYIAEDIQKKITEGVMPKEIAVLSRNNRDVLPFADIFIRNKIPFVIEADNNILTNIVIQKLLLLLRTINDIGNDALLIRSLHIDSLGVDPLDIYKLELYAQSQHLTLWEMMSNEAPTRDLGLHSIETVHRVYEQFKQWKTMSENDSFDALFIDVLNNSGIMKSVLSSLNALDSLDNITSLYEDIKLNIERKPLFHLADYIQYLDILDAHSLSIHKSVSTVQKQAVRLMTAHKSKGLEFDFVYIINTYDKHWGNMKNKGSSFAIPWNYLTVKYEAISGQERNEDERRLFFVALTRARKDLLISYSTHGLDGKEQVPSQFIYEIHEDLRVPVSVAEFEAAFTAHKEQLLLPRPSYSEQEIVEKFKENAVFFADIFRKKGLSVSALNNYLSCPWKFFFRNLLMIPDVKNMSLIFGNAVHKALHEYIVQRDIRETNAEFLSETFIEALRKEPLTHIEFESLREKGHHALRGYYEEQAKNWPPKLESEVSIRGIQLSNDITLNGKLDLIEHLPGDDEVRVYDFKTGKPKSRKVIEGDGISEPNGDYKRQLVFYKLLLNHYHEGKMKMVQGIITFIEPTDAGNYKNEVFEITDSDIEELMNLINRVSAEIISFSYWNTRCDDRECEYCHLRDFISPRN